MEVQIQFQDISGSWLTVRLLPLNDPQMITFAMKDVKMSHPDKKVRAVDMNGRLLDIMP